VVGHVAEDGDYACAAHGQLVQLVAVLPQDRVIAITDGGIDSWDEIALDIAAKAQDMRA
jgi:hypothetical protein